MSTLLEPSKNLTRLSKSILTQEQQNAITAIYESNRLLVSPMGGGKTVIAATAIAELLDNKELGRVLVVTTPKIANTVWQQEFKKWEHTAHISVGIATGTPEERLEILNDKSYQVVVVTFNVLPWLKDKQAIKTFSGLLIDETTKLKSSGGEQFKAIRKHLKHFTWRCGLTGTPVSEDFIGLYAQIMLVDNGVTFGRNKQAFLDQYFYATDYKQYSWKLRDNADREIMEKVRGIVYLMPDYRAELPDIEYVKISMQLPVDLRAYYDDLRKEMINDDVVANTAAVLSQKLQQVANGFVYTEEGTKRLSDYRLQRLKQLTDTLPGNHIICYWYKEDLAQLKMLYPDAEEITPTRLDEQVKAWNSKKIKTLLIHPRSAGHGLQLEQGGCTVIWLSPVWSNDLWEQTNARVWRRGQKNKVTIYRLIAEGTVDALIDQRVKSKAEYDKLFKEHLKA